MGKVRRSSAILLAIAFTGGCATTGGKIAVAIGGIAAVGTVISASQPTGDCRDDFGACTHSWATTGALALTTGAALFAALVFEVLGAPDQPAPAVAPTPTRPPGTVGKPVAATGDYLPPNFGVRFSTNAAAASR